MAKRFKVSTRTISRTRKKVKDSPDLEGVQTSIKITQKDKCGRKPTPFSEITPKHKKYFFSRELR